MSVFTKSSLSINLAWLLVVLLFGLLFKLLFLNAPLQSDDTSYFAWASDLSMELFRSAGHQAPLRLGLLIPLAFIQSFFGYSLAAYYMFSIGSSSFLLLMIYAIGFRFGGLQTAVFSSLLFACSYFGLYQATNLLPDVPNLALILASFLTFTFVDRARGRIHILIIFLAALLAFSSYLVRAPNLVFLLAIPVYELLTRKSLKATSLFAIFFTILWFCESCFYLIIAEDFFLRTRMILTGTTSWAKFMPEVSWQKFFWEPLTLLSNTLSGMIIIWGGLTGVFIAIWKRNYGLIALLAGALLLFVIYSYSLTSISPIRRALPLNTRYIVPFTAVLTIATGYAITVLGQQIRGLISANISSLILTLILITLMGFQIRKLPEELPNTILFKDSSYFVADRLAKDIDNIANLKGNVFAYPIKDFKMYKNFSSLDLNGFSPSDIGGDAYYLYSRQKIRIGLRYGWLGQDEKVIRNQNLLLLPVNPNWDYLINTKEIVLAYVPALEQIPNEIITMDGSYFAGEWGKPDTVTEEIVGSSVKFQFNQMEKPFYLYLFSESFSRPPQGHTELFDRFQPDEVYELKIQYRIENEMRNLGIFYHQYNNEEKINSGSFNVPSSLGAHVATKLITTSPSFKKFRLFFRIDDNQKENQLTIEKISFSLVK